MSKEEITFTDGLRVRKVNEYKFGLSINYEKFTEWLKAYKNEQGYINIDICKSKEKENWYGKLNTWKPENKQNKTENNTDDTIVKFGDEEIPF